MLNIEIEKGIKLTKQDQQIIEAFRHEAELYPNDTIEENWLLSRVYVVG